MARRSQRTGCLGSLINFLAALLLLAACGLIFGFVYIFVAPGQIQTPAFVIDLLDNTADQPLPTTVAVALIPSPTATPTDSPIQATFTPVQLPPTATPRPSNTPRPTDAPTAVPIFPSRTPTPTPTNTPTFTPTATPTGPTPTPQPTRSSFLFTKTDNSPFYLRNSANSAGCDWMGIAGEVLDLSGNPVAVGSYRVHVWGEGLGDRYALAGSAPDYSASGWEVFLFNAPVAREYNVQLESQNGTAVSQVYRVQTRASCDDNLVRLDFVQNH